MVHPGNSQEDMTEKDTAPPGGASTLQKARARFLRGVSYFSGDMEVFGKWMESKLTLTALKNTVLTLIHRSLQCPTRHFSLWVFSQSLNTLAVK